LDRSSPWPFVVGIVLGLCVTGIAAEAATPVYDLGGPCLDDQPHGAALDEYMDLHRRLTRAVRREAWDTVIALQKKSVRLMCDNPYRWFTLAEYHRRAGQDTAALRVVTHVYEHHPNEVEQRLADGYELLVAVRASRPFEGSRLQAMMRKNRRALRTRRRRYRRSLRELPDARKPPERYVARDVCPFECCVYRTWSVHGPVTVYERPRSDTVVARLEAGDTVQGMTGNVYLRPRPVALRQKLYLGRDPRTSQKVYADTGEMVFELDYIGEGFSNVWYRGNVHTVSSYSFRNHCPRPGEDCRAEYVHDGGEAYPRSWWVKIRLPDGTMGWTDEVEPFGNMDACG